MIAANDKKNEQIFVAVGKEEFVELLLKSGADVNAKNSDQSAPLHFASKRGNSKFGKICSTNSVKFSKH